MGEVFHQTGLDKVVVHADIQNKVKTIELLCNQLPKEIKENADESASNFCLENLHDMVIRIREDLKQIKACGQLS